MPSLINKKILVAIISFSAIFLLPQFVFAAPSPDAIAIRVVPNLNHYSPLRWYQENIKTQGSPQNLSVDGYEAVRDGRTVYANVANVVNNIFYTNIYIVSYNQSAENATTDIFGQILFHWKFNTNIPQTDSPNCHKITATSCIHDSDCQAGDYCQSNKAILNRDTKRLSDLAELKISLESYLKQHGYYPKLASGSYLPNKTISVWPSWQSNLGSGLSITIPKDPINQLGSCPEDYDKTTCWDQKNKKFYDPTPADSEFTLPNGSYGYVYVVGSDGAKYNLCTYAESGFIEKGNNGACQNSGSTIIGETEKSQTPVFTGSNLKSAYSGKAYQGYVEAIDPFNNSLIWSVVAKSGCDMWEGLALKSTSVSRQKEVTAVKAGVGGICTITVTIDNRKPGGKIMKDFDINVINYLPVIEQIDTQTIVVGQTRNLTITATEPDKQYPLTFNFGATLASIGFNTSGNPYPSDGKYKVDITGAHTDPVSEMVEKTVNLTVTDIYRGATSTSFKMIFTNKKPAIGATSHREVIVGHNINYTITVADPDQSSSPLIDHYPLTFNASGLPGGVNYSTTANRHDLNMVGIAVDQTKDYPVIVKATDKYTAESDPASFTITVKNNPPVLPASLTESIGCVDYSFSFPEVDVDGHSITYTTSNLPNGLSLSNNEIGGKPMVAAGDYGNIAVNAKDQYYSQTIPPYNAEDNETYTLKVNNELFDLNVVSDAANADNTIYVYPAGVTQILYHGPIQFNANSSVTTGNHVTYSLTGQPSWLTIGPATGKIQGTPTNNTADPGDYTITVKAANDCGAAATKQITIHVLKNEWCGDGVTSNNEQCENNGNGTSQNDQYRCNACQWLDGWCGDGVCDSGHNESCGTCATDCGCPISCLDIKNKELSSSTGIYRVDPDGAGGNLSFNVYCNMTTDSGGWTLIMKAVDAKFGYNDSYWTSSNTLNDDNFNFTTSGGKSKYQSFNTVAFSEIMTSDINNFNDNFKYNLGTTYSNARQLFSGSSIEISSGSLNNYFNGLTPAIGQHWAVCGGAESDILTVGINISKDWGPHSPVYSVCDWGGGAKFGQIVNGFHGGTGDIQGQGWGARNLMNSDQWNFSISQLLWIR